MYGNYKKSAFATDILILPGMARCGYHPPLLIIQCFRVGIRKIPDRNFLILPGMACCGYHLPLLVRRAHHPHFFGCGFIPSRAFLPHLL